MTDTAERVSSQTADRARPTSDVRSPRPCSRRRVAAHAALLLLVLSSVTALVHNGFPAIADEGAVLAQVDHLGDGRLTEPEDWRLPRPFPELDPEGDVVPLDLSLIAGDDYLPYAKHALYPAVIESTRNVLGETSATAAAVALALSVLGTWLAALVGGLIARRVRPDLQIATIWVLGLGTPLLFDSTVAMAHSLGAAAFGFLVVCLLRYLDPTTPGPVPRVVALAGAMCGTILAVLLRSEGMLAVLATACVLGLWSLRHVVAGPAPRRRFDPSAALAAATIGVTGAAAYLLDGRVSAILQGATGIDAVTTAGDFDLVAGRRSALWASVLRPAHLIPTWGSLVLLVACVALLAAAVILRFLPARRNLALGLLSAAAALAVLRQFAPLTLVSGLLPATPVLIGLLFLRRRDLRDTSVRFCLSVAGLAALAIWMTSYPEGGAFEWGGRFFHTLLPIVVPAALLGLDTAVRSLQRAPATTATTAADSVARAWPLRSPAARLAAGSLLVFVASLSVLSVRTSAQLRQANEEMVVTALDAAAAARPAADGGDPILISDARPLGRMGWAFLDDHRMLRAPDEERLGPLLAGLADDGVGTVTLMVTPFQQLPEDARSDWTVVAERGSPGSNVSYLELRQSDTRQER